MYCRNCGSEIDDKAFACPYCGVATSEAQNHSQPNIVINNTNQAVNSIHPMTSQKNKWVAFILCLFGGVFGIHRFYVGKRGTGLIWLCTVGLLGIGWVIDLILILCGSFRDKYGFPLVG